jgi:ubiquitin carboxyl-terminal hydrolase 5/13
MQAVFATKDFQKHYFENLKLEDAFRQAPADPTLDLDMQLAKLAHGILSGKYAVASQKTVESEATEEANGNSGQDGIPPRMFKSLIGTGHPEFASSRQQDALEYFQHFLEQVERTRASIAAENHVLLIQESEIYQEN